MSALTPEPMTPDELTQHEAIIERGQQTFVEVGLALLAIREARGYHTAGFATFETYCQERWGWGIRRAEQLMQAAEYVEEQQNTNHGSPLPATEREARQMMRDERRASIGLPPQRPAPTDPTYADVVPTPVERPAETSARLLAQVGDPDGRIAQARLRAAWAAAVYQTRSNLLPLDATALVAVLTPPDLERLAWWLRDMRAYLDTLEQAVNASYQLHVVGGPVR